MHSRFHRRRQGPRLGGAPVVDPWPVLRPPGPDQGLSTLPGGDRRGRRTPAGRVEPRREILRPGRDTKFHRHDGANPAERPSIRVKAGLPGASPQPLPQGLPRPWGETGRAPRSVALVQTAAGALVFSQLLRPSADRRAADAPLARNGRLGEVAGVSQPTGFQPAFFTLRTGERPGSPSHGHPVSTNFPEAQ
jgi:hypothetical protein